MGEAMSAKKTAAERVAEGLTGMEAEQADWEEGLESEEDDEDGGA